MSPRRVLLLALPYDSGRRAWRMGAGPEALLAAGAGDRLRALGFAVETEVVEVPEAEAAPEPGTSFALYRRLAARVAAARAAGAVPLVLAGNCGSALGTVAGLGPDRTAVAWFDAHGDFNTPETSPSGFLDGMALAVLTGRAWRALAASIPGFAPLADGRASLVGARDLDPPEREALAASGVGALPVETLRRRGVAAACTELAARLAIGGAAPGVHLGAPADRLYLHLDLDVLDPGEGRVNGYAAAGGLTLAEVEEAVAALARRIPLGAGAFTALDPTADPDGRALAAALRLIEAVGRAAAG